MGIFQHLTANLLAWPFCLILSTLGARVGASAGFVQGIDYIESTEPNAQQIATDSSGAIYILSFCTNSGTNSGLPFSCVTKLSMDGKTILWRNQLGFIAYRMAVDRGGNVFLISSPDADPFVQKLSADGSRVSWQTPLGSGMPFGSGPRNGLTSIAVDLSGRTFVAGFYEHETGGYVVGLNSAGVVEYTTTVTALPVEIAVAPAGSLVAVVLLSASGSSTLAWLAPDRGSKSYSTIPQVRDIALAVAPNGDAVVYGTDINGHGFLQRIDATGAIRFSETITGSDPAGVAVDVDGNAYITGYSGSVMRPVRNTLATCGTAWLSVIAPDGSTLQSTYIPGASRTFRSLLSVATSPTAVFLLIRNADASYTPTQAGPFGANPTSSSLLLRLSPNANAQTFPLACAGNSASNNTGPVAPGELVTLFGTGLGPQQGIATRATLETPFPTQVANTEVTFDGRPARLLWVQENQINAVVPWDLAGPTTQICVSHDGASTNCLTWSVAEAVPGVFTVDGTHAAALNEDGSINSASNPAQPGSIVSVFATGLGPISPAQPDGTLVDFPLPVNVLPLRLTQACASILCSPSLMREFPVIYGGPAPFLVGGASQINFPAANPGALILSVQGLSPAYSNAFAVYVAGQ